MPKYVTFGLVILTLVICLLCALVFREEPTSAALRTVKGGGIILCFDDDYVFDWYDADKVLSKYHWKATFFVSHFPSLDATDVERLRILQSNGHEIGAHGVRHLNALQFVSPDTLDCSNSLDKYIRLEILPAIQAMTHKGLMVSSFAYPYGARNQRTDKALQTYFTMLRGTTCGDKPPPRHVNYANGSRVVFGLGIDRSNGGDLKHVLQMLEYTRKQSKIAMFYGHRIRLDDASEWTTSLQTLEAVCQFAVENNMRFMTLKELVISPQMQSSAKF